MPGQISGSVSQTKTRRNVHIKIISPSFGGTTQKRVGSRSAVYTQRGFGTF
jgi:hypothetical protein